MTSLTLERLALGAIAALYLLLGALFAIRTPDWQNPDEPAHYNYIAQVASTRCCPVIEPGDWQQAYLSELTSSRFHPERLARLETIQYEDHQPPLYYLLASLAYRLTSGDLTALRLLSVAIGLIVVLCAYGVGRTLYPTRSQIGLGAAAFIAFIPQHLAMLSAVNNDGVAEAIIGLALLGAVCLLAGKPVPRAAVALLLGAWLLAMFVAPSSQDFGLAFALVTVALLVLAALRGRSHSRDEQTIAFLAGVVGLGALTKANTLFLFGLIPFAILLWWRHSNQRRIGSLIGAWALFLVPALLLALTWWGRNLTVYGVPDFLGLAAHDRVVADQPRTAETIAQFGTEGYLRFAVETTFNSFWGQFGWMALPLQAWIYTAVLAGLLVAALGGLIGLVRRISPEPASAWRPAAWLVLTAAVILAAAQFVYYQTEFLQLQGRYLYPALIPLGLWVVLGFDGWRRFLLGDRRAEWGRWLPVAAALLLAPLSLYLVWRVIPQLAP